MFRKSIGGGGAVLAGVASCVGGGVIQLETFQYVYATVVNADNVLGPPNICRVLTMIVTPKRRMLVKRFVLFP